MSDCPSQPSLIAGSDRLFALSGPHGVRPQDIQRDEHGFVERSAATLTVEDLFEVSAALVVGPPFLGKTTVAKAIHHRLQQETSGGDKAVARLFHSWLEDLGTGRPFPPPEWKAWKSSTDRAFWLIDALDEGEHRYRGLSQDLLETLGNLSAAERQRLRLIVFCRGSEVPEKFRGGLEEIYGDELAELELLPVSRRSAKAIVTEGKLPRVLKLIKESDLAPIAGYPCVLETLKTMGDNENHSQIGVWKLVLEDLLRARYRTREDREPEQEIEFQFEAASRLAIALTLGPDEELVSESTTPGLQVPDVLPGLLSSSDAALLKRETLRNAAHEALKSGMFRRTGQGHRFAQRNVRDWMCAWGLRCWPPEKIKPLFLDDDNKIRLRFSEVARLLEDVARDQSKDRLSRWLAEVQVGEGQEGVPVPSDASPWNLTRLREWLDHFEQRAIEAGWLWLDQERLKMWERIPGLGSELARRLADETKSPAARDISLSVAIAVGSPEVLPRAIEILQSSEENEQLRLNCAVFMRLHGGKNVLKELEPFVEAAEPTTRNQQKVIAYLIEALLNSDLWTPFDAYKHLPAVVHEPVIDVVTLLPRVINEKMQISHAQAIIQEAAAGGFREEMAAFEESHREPPDPLVPDRVPKSEVFLEAVRKIAEQPSPRAKDLEALIPFCLQVDRQILTRELGLRRSLEEAFRKRKKARRQLFEEYARHLGRSSGQQPLNVWQRVLAPEDLDWLLRKLPGLDTSDDTVALWGIPLTLADKEDLSVEQRIRVRSQVKKHAPEQLASFDENTKILEQWEEEQQAAQVNDSREELRPIEEINRELLESTDIGLQQQLWNLSWVNFSEAGWRPSNVEGAWDDLPGTMQEEILRKCKATLHEVDPTPIPDGGSAYPSRLIYEAQAFIQVLLLRSEDFELTAELVYKWLGSVLCFPFSQKIEVLERCFQAQPEPTEKVVLREIEREVDDSEDDYSILLQNLPEALWSKSIVEWVEGKVLSDETANRARVAFLQRLGARKPARGRKIAQELLEDRNLRNLQEELFIAESVEDLDLAVANVLLALAPESIWVPLKEVVEIHGSKLLKKLEALYEPIRGGLQARLAEWQNERLQELTEILFVHYPPKTDPDLGPVYSLNPELDLRNLRWKLLALLFDSQSRGAGYFLENLGDQYPEVKTWLARRKAEAELETATEGLSVVETEPTHYREEFTRDQVCKAIQNADYRLVRNEGDLLDVVLEELHEIEETVAKHLDMLYQSRFEPGSDQRKRQHERALQAYISCRLEDRLPGNVLDRETEIRYRQRPDVRVLAPTIQNETAIITIEVKWSDNDDISTSLKNQLGEKYLRDEQLTHGIYLVGWTGAFGTWRRVEFPRPKTGNLDSFRKALERQAGELKDDNPDLTVRPFVLDCPWKKPEATS